MKTPRCCVFVSLGALLLLLFCAPAKSQPACGEMCSACPDEYDPVCGTNDVFYKNECFLENDACLLAEINSVNCTPIGIAAESLDCEYMEQPMGFTMEIDDEGNTSVTSEPTMWPNGFLDDGSSSDSWLWASSGSSDSDDDSTDSSPFVPPPHVVFDDSAPAAEDFIPSIDVLPAVDNGDDDSVGVEVVDTPVWSAQPDGDDEDEDEDEKDLDVDDDDEDNLDAGDGMQVLEYSEWLKSASSVSSSSSGDGSDGSDGSDQDGDIYDAQCEILCLSRFEPVCATDGVTYANNCEFSVAQCIDPSIAVAHEGDCANDIMPVTPYPVADGDDPCAYVCAMLDHPVCSNDGHIYANECAFQSELCRDATLQPAVDTLCMTP